MVLIKKLLYKILELLLSYIIGGYIAVIIIVICATIICSIKDYHYQITNVYGILPAIIITKEVSLNKSVANTMFAGATIGPIVLSSADNNEREKIIVKNHELCHVRQFYKSLGMQLILYRFSKKYRILYEYEAYKTDKSLTNDDIVDILHSSYVKKLSKNKIRTIINAG